MGRWLTKAHPENTSVPKQFQKRFFFFEFYLTYAFTLWANTGSDHIKMPGEKLGLCSWTKAKPIAQSAAWWRGGCVPSLAGGVDLACRPGWFVTTLLGISWTPASQHCVVTKFNTREWGRSWETKAWSWGRREATLIQSDNCKFSSSVRSNLNLQDCLTLCNIPLWCLH